MNAEETEWRPNVKTCVIKGLQIVLPRDIWDESVEYLII